MNLSQIATNISEVAAELSSDNAVAARIRERRLVSAIEEYAEAYGISNAVGMLAQFAERKADESAENSDARKSWELAVQILEGAMAGVDLAYSEDHGPYYHHQCREKAVSNVRKMAQEIAP